MYFYLLMNKDFIIIIIIIIIIGAQKKSPSQVPELRPTSRDTFSDLGR